MIWQRGGSDHYNILWLLVMSCMLRVLLIAIVVLLHIATTLSTSRPSFVEQRAMIPMKLDVPVWSLSTLNADSMTTNMNIVTYATQVGIKPHPVYAISLYKGTLSHDNFKRNGWGALQLLPSSASSCVSLLGKQSGRDVDKVKHLEELGIRLSSLDVESELSGRKTLQIIHDSPMILIAEYRSSEYAAVDVGDHEVMLCEIVDSRGPRTPDTDADSASSALPYLTTQLLRSMNII